MAEQSVQGRIHSVFWEKLPIPLRGADWLRKFLNSSSHTPPRAYVMPPVFNVTLRDWPRCFWPVLSLG